MHVKFVSIKCISCPTVIPYDGRPLPQLWWDYVWTCDDCDEKQAKAIAFYRAMDIVGKL